MKWIDLDDLLARMARLEKAAFKDFNRTFRKLIKQWCRRFGLSNTRAELETERCLFEIAILAVQRASEIGPGRFKLWAHLQSRNLVIKYWALEMCVL